MTKVSIIVPVYNVENYLEECLNSLLNQTLQDIEIICINDGSIDNSLEILNKYVQKDLRIKVINKQNEGQGIARNLGIDIAQGEYIGFVDSDDWVELDMFEQMYNQAKKLSSQIVICDYKKYQEKNGKFIVSNIFRNMVSLTKSKAVKFVTGENLDKTKLNQTLLVSPCYSVNRIYKAELLKKNNIKFDTIRCYEDCVFILRSHVETNNISYINKPFYCYRIRKSSTLRSNDKRYIDLICVIKLLKKYLLEHNLMDKFQRNFDYFCVANIYRAFSLLESDELRKELLILSEDILSEKLLKELQKKFFVSVKLLNELFSSPLKLPQKLGNLLYYKKYLLK